MDKNKAPEACPANGIEKSAKWIERDAGDYKEVKNEGGATLGYSPASGIGILTVDGFAFKDLNKNGVLDKYEDWRLPVEERARDLASKMTIEQIAGLMLYSMHQAVPASGGWFGGTYGGKPYEESGAKPWDLSDQQIEFLTKDNLRHVLVTTFESTEAAARWNNKVQALVEGIGLGIPANNSSDPRHGCSSNAEYNAGAGGGTSMWPEALGLAATFDPELVKRFGEIVAEEYRALGITTALSPQIDLATEPRWGRFIGTFGEDPKLSADMARAVVEGYQTSSREKEIEQGWGYGSINAMVKHWPGGGSGEGGRDAHFGFGKYAVYPGNNFDQHLVPFVDGAFKLSGGTGMASAVMPYYTVSYNQDVKNGENVGNSYSAYIIQDLLRGKYGFDGVVCTDWAITDDEPPSPDAMFPGGRCWGVEEGHTVAQRHYKAIMAGVDQFGGNNLAGPIIEAYNMGAAEHGEEFMRKRFEESAVRLLKNIFRVGLFENPYLDVKSSIETVGKREYMAAGYEAQLKSIVLLKNKNNILPVAKGKTVYIPKRYRPAGKDWFGNPTPEFFDYPVSLPIVQKYFHVTENPDEADYALVFIESPSNGLNAGYSKEDAEAGGNGYVPISLQYGPYKAEYARDPSLAGDAREGKAVNRSYRGKWATAFNSYDLKMVLDARRAMKGKPVIVSLKMSNPTVVGEFEAAADAIVAEFGVQHQAVLDILTGAAEPSALLPMQMPADMKTVEEQKEDVPRDMECYVDSEGNRYDFAFGLNWKGVIRDERTEKYK
ncbi:MAG: glycoside hydrolase family 3 N-terminal domain-containing protein [Clostridiales bacterium]|jgi:beta-glucosidase|nr:glycoside hydrolase family 3 C-terminal domain-containing protein [Eubacteriales bacterium]MDH7566445.1 glycoside hydrolase family 3 N-terminal domain-containing protein [Clostridiales bacterium]